MKNTSHWPAGAALALAVAGVLAFTCVGCPKPNPPVPPPDVTTTDADISDGADPEDPPLDAAAFPDCVRACAKLKSLGCPEAAKPDGGKTCYKVCADAESTGKFSLNPKCVASQADVSGVRSCATVRCLK
jgi:hypothetical protein